MAITLTRVTKYAGDGRLPGNQSASFQLLWVNI
jgi:hypothetical protein